MKNSPYSFIPSPAPIMEVDRVRQEIQKILDEGCHMMERLRIPSSLQVPNVREAYDSAVDIFTRALLRVRQQSLSTQSLASLEASVLVHLGRAYTKRGKKGDDTRALSVFTMAMNTGPISAKERLTARKSLAWLLLETYPHYAQDVLKRKIDKEEPELDFEGRYLLGESQRKQGDLEGSYWTHMLLLRDIQAIHDRREPLDLSCLPLVEALMMLGSSFLERKDMEKAADAFLSARRLAKIQEDPEREADALVHRGLALKEMAQNMKESNSMEQPGMLRAAMACFSKCYRKCRANVTRGRRLWTMRLEALEHLHAIYCVTDPTKAKQCATLIAQDRQAMRDEKRPPTIEERCPSPKRDPKSARDARDARDTFARRSSQEIPPPQHTPHPSSDLSRLIHPPSPVYRQ